jgi:hypothetical protein
MSGLLFTRQGWPSVQVEFEMPDVDVFCYSVKKMENNNLKQRYGIKFSVNLKEGITDTNEKIRKCLVVILYHMHKYFSGTKTL